MRRVARCCCDRLSIIVNSDPKIQGICHCDDCKKRTGSAFGWSAYFFNSQVDEAIGEANQYHIEGLNKQTRYFCKNCGTTLYWSASAFKNMIGVSGGCFVDNPLPEPNLTVSNKGRCLWLGLPAGWRQSI